MELKYHQIMWIIQAMSLRKLKWRVFSCSISIGHIATNIEICTITKHTWSWCMLQSSLLILIGRLRIADVKRKRRRSRRECQFVIDFVWEASYHMWSVSPSKCIDDTAVLYAFCVFASVHYAPLCLHAYSFVDRAYLLNIQCISILRLSWLMLLLMLLLYCWFSWFRCINCRCCYSLDSLWFVPYGFLVLLLLLIFFFFAIFIFLSFFFFYFLLVSSSSFSSSPYSHHIPATPFFSSVYFVLLLLLLQ